MKKLYCLLLLMWGLALVQAQEGTVVKGSNLAEKFDWLNVFAQSNTSYIIELNANENIGRSFSFNGKSGITIILKGIGANRTINGRYDIESGVTLVLDNNITIQGDLYLENGGLLIMNAGSAIIGGQVTIGLSTFYPATGGTFTMNGGRISGNKSSYSSSGMGVFLDKGTFIMNEGTISGNENYIWGYGGSGGVYMSGGTFIMNGGTISGNTGTNGGGVGVSSGTFTMNGGSISGNEATTKTGNTVINGGGVHIFNGTFNMNGGTISGNKAFHGGGVFVDNGPERGIFNMKGGTISGNIAHRLGGGVCSVSSFNMSDGTISGNTARNAGGGVYIERSFTKTGGTITGYDSDQKNGNAVKNDSGAVRNYRGHAVLAGTTDTLLRIREGTAEPDDNLSFTTTYERAKGFSYKADGAWDNGDSDSASTSSATSDAVAATTTTPSSGITITGLSAYKDKYIWAFHFNKDTALALFAVEGISNIQNFTAAKINGDSVTLNVFKDTNESLPKYNGNDKNIIFGVSIVEKAQINSNNFESSTIAFGTATANFTNGICSGVFTPAPAAQAYNIGDTGPAGGLIFYDKGNNYGGWRYLEAAPVRAEFQARWTINRTGVNNTQKAIGSGKQNTQLIVESFKKSTGEWDTAAQKCYELNFGGFNDWFLPSRDELAQMYGNLKRRNLGNFKNEEYWSSSFTPSNMPTVAIINFRNGEISENLILYDYRTLRNSRPIRQVPGP